VRCVEAGTLCHEKARLLYEAPSFRGIKQTDRASEEGKADVQYECGWHHKGSSRVVLGRGRINQGYR
jgi:hypothetical protein